MSTAPTVGKRMIERMPFVVSKLQFRADKEGYLLAVHQGSPAADYCLVAVPWYERCIKAEDLFRLVVEVLEQEKLQPYTKTSDPVVKYHGVNTWHVFFPNGHSFELVVAAYDHNYEKRRTT